MPWIYHTDLNNSVRYTLGITGNNPLVCFGINPSTASPGNLDNTIRSVERLAFGNGFDSWIMLNLYPLRETNPDQLSKNIDRKLHKNNLLHIEKIVSAQPLKIWAAWGTLIMKQKYLQNCLKDIVDISMKYNSQWYSIGKESKRGHPHHPLYLRSDEKMKLFDIESYCAFF